MTMFRLLKDKSMKAGLSPGSLIHVGEERATSVNLSLIDYNRDTFTEVSPATMEQCLSCKDQETVTWINVDGLHQVAIIEQLCQGFDLHPLTIEDILNTTQRPKLDVYDEYLYLVLRMNSYNTNTGEVDSEQVSLILGEGFLLTFQEKEGDTFDPVRSRLRHNKGRVRKMAADYLAYALMDSVVDNYFAVLEKMGEEIELLEEDLLTNPTPDTLHTIHALKRETILLRKSIWPLREVVNSMQRDEVPHVSESITFFLKDLYDHTIQVIDTVETFRDIISGMLDIYLSSISNRMNEIMKVLTLFAAIFIPLTFIAGIYGMNFNPERSPLNMPELNWYFGYPFAMGLMAVTGIGLYLYFRRKHWF